MWSPSSTSRRNNNFYLRYQNQKVNWKNCTFSTHTHGTMKTRLYGWTTDLLYGERERGVYRRGPFYHHPIPNNGNLPPLQRSKGKPEETVIVPPHPHRVMTTPSPYFRTLEMYRRWLWDLVSVPTNNCLFLLCGSRSESEENVLWST